MITNKTPDGHIFMIAFVMAVLTMVAVAGLYYGVWWE